MIICTNCGSPNPDEILVCEQCGRKIQSRRRTISEQEERTSRPLDVPSLEHASWLDKESPFRKDIESWVFILILLGTALYSLFQGSWEALWLSVPLVALLAYVRKL